MEPPRKQAKMVGWFDPPVLAQTAVHMATANVFGRHSDSRLVEALASQPQACFDYPAADSDGLWLDYVADIGDGWNATYAIAEALARPTLEVTTQAGGTVASTRSGRVLVFGGDEGAPLHSTSKRREHRGRRPTELIPSKLAQQHVFSRRWIDRSGLTWGTGDLN